jgi:hypothetical protein
MLENAEDAELVADLPWSYFALSASPLLAFADNCQLSLS